MGFICCRDSNRMLNLGGEGTGREKRERGGGEVTSQGHLPRASSLTGQASVSFLFLSFLSFSFVCLFVY